MVRFCWTALFLMAVSAAFGVPALPPRAEQPAVEVVSINVQSPRPADEDGPARRGQTFIHVQVKLPGKEIVGFGPDSKLESFTDDKGTDLAEAGNQFNGAKFPLSVTSLIGKDRSKVTYQMYTSKVPASGAREFRMKGDFQVLVGAEATVNSATVALAPGTNVAIGTVKFSVAGTPANPTVKLQYVAETFKEVEFEDAGTNQLIKASKTSGGGSKDQKTGRTQWYQEYSLGQRPAKIKVTVRTYDKIESVTVPVELKFGVGLN